MSVKRFDGGNWVDPSFHRRYSGNAWIDVESEKRFNGSTWVDVYIGAIRFRVSYTGMAYLNITTASDGLISIKATNSTPAASITIKSVQIFKAGKYLDVGEMTLFSLGNINNYQFGYLNTDGSYSYSAKTNISVGTAYKLFGSGAQTTSKDTQAVIMLNKTTLLSGQVIEFTIGIVSPITYDGRIYPVSMDKGSGGGQS